MLPISIPEILAENHERVLRIMMGPPRWCYYVKNLPANAGDTGDASLIPGLGRSPGEENGSPLPYPCLGNSVERGAWGAVASLPAEL